MKCQDCGNAAYFIAISSVEARQVNRYGDHVRLLRSEVDRYECYECGSERVQGTGPYVS